MSYRIKTDYLNLVSTRNGRNICVYWFIYIFNLGAECLKVMWCLHSLLRDTYILISRSYDSNATDSSDNYFCSLIYIYFFLNFILSIFRNSILLQAYAAWLLPKNPTMSYYNVIFLKVFTINSTNYLSCSPISVIYIMLAYHW